jgi:hypothetical protein
MTPSHIAATRVGRLVVLAAVCCLLLSACNGDDDSAPPSTAATTSTAVRAASGTAAQYAAAIAVAIRADRGFSSVPARDARCAARAAVAAIGLGTLHRLGVSPAEVRRTRKFPRLEGELSDAQATALTDALLGCIDFGRVIADQIEANSPNHRYRATQPQVDCLNTKIEGDARVRRAIANTYTGGRTPANRQGLDILGLAAQCVPLAEALGNANVGPSATTP